MAIRWDPCAADRAERREKQLVTNELEWRRDRDRFVDPGEDGNAESGVGPLAAQFAELGHELFAEATVAGVLQRVVRAALDIVPGAELVSVTMRRGDEQRFTTPAYTDDLAVRIDEVQYEANEGPCVDATKVDSPGVVLCPDLRESAPRWPVFGPGAARLGMGALLGIGLFPRGAPPRLGALNIYSTQPRGLDDADANVALLLAAHVSTALTATMRIEAAELEAAQLREALESRDVIGQAKGILMQRQGIDASAAFDILRQSSQRLNTRLAEIAKTLVARRDEL